jgi:hypothetical protein
MHRFVTLWIICCIILHNLIIRLEKDTGIFDDGTWPGEEEVVADNEDMEIDDEDRENDGAVGNEEQTSGTLFRQKVMADLLKRLNNMQDIPGQKID